MTNTNMMTVRCRNCGRAHQVNKDENRQYNWELNGFCSYSCDFQWYDRSWEYERIYRP